MCLACLLGGDTADHVCAICESLFAVECTLKYQLFSYYKRILGATTCRLAREALAKDLGVLVDEEVPDGILVAATGGRLGERPAPSWRTVSSDTTGGWKGKQLRSTGRTCG